LLRHGTAGPAGLIFETAQAHSDTFVPSLLTKRKTESEPPKMCALAKDDGSSLDAADTPLE